jgi:hypothetical protein
LGSAGAQLDTRLSIIWRDRRLNLHANLNGTFTRHHGARRMLGVMRWAFVLQLGSQTRPADRHFDGRIEEVDTGRELRFRSTDELLGFMALCFQIAGDRQPARREENDGCRAQAVDLGSRRSS